MKRAVFLDKDGTLIENVPYNIDPVKVNLLPFAAEALSRLDQQGYLPILISNQSGIAMGYFTEPELHAVIDHIARILNQQRAGLYAYYYCPHSEHAAIAAYAQECTCRKPAPGMLQRAAREHDIDLSASWMIGDILDDVEAGHRAGCKTILINNGNETEWKEGPGREPDHIVHNWNEAAAIILSS